MLHHFAQNRRTPQGKEERTTLRLCSKRTSLSAYTFYLTLCLRTGDIDSMAKLDNAKHSQVFEAAGSCDLLSAISRLHR